MKTRHAHSKRNIGSEGDERKPSCAVGRSQVFPTYLVSSGRALEPHRCCRGWRWARHQWRALLHGSPAGKHPVLRRACVLQLCLLRRLLAVGREDPTTPSSFWPGHRPKVITSVSPRRWRRSSEPCTLPLGHFTVPGSRLQKKLGPAAEKPL
jgi:hypothetical protein